MNGFTKTVQIGFWGVLVLLLVSTQPVAAQDDTSIRAAAIDVPPGQQRLVMMPGPIERVAIGNPKVADVSVTGDKQVMVTGNARGNTSLIVWMRNSTDPMRFPVNIAATDAPVLGGSGDDFSVQVQTDIQIAELSRNTLRQIGFNFASNSPGESAIGVSPPGKSAGINPLGMGMDVLSNTAFKPIGDAFNLVISDSNKNTAGYLSILERRGLMNILSEPSLVAMSGQTATFLAGGEFPIPVAQGGAGVGGNSAITIQFKQFGIQLTLTPTVLSPDRIVLKLAPSVSELDFSSAVTLNGVQVPGLRKRRTDTTVELGDGQSFIISGLVDRNMMANVDKVPGLGDIPILGSFFRSTSYERRNRELIMIVTPHLVTPLARGTKVKLPGEEYKGYDPGSAQLFLNESGNFDPADRIGFSK